MGQVSLLFIFVIILNSCSISKKLPDTIGDPQNAVSYGYQPIDPLPAYSWIKWYAETDTVLEMRTTQNCSNEDIMRSLPDETIRLAIGEIDGKGNINFATTQIGYEGINYVVVLDYVKFETRPLPIKIFKDSINKNTNFKRWVAKGKANTPRGRGRAGYF